MSVIAQGAAQAAPWLLGEQFSAADVYLGSHILFGLKFKSVEPHPAAQRLLPCPVWQRAAASDDALVAGNG